MPFGGDRWPWGSRSPPPVRARLRKINTLSSGLLHLLLLPLVRTTARLRPPVFANGLGAHRVSPALPRPSVGLPAGAWLAAFGRQEREDTGPRRTPRWPKSSRFPVWASSVSPGSGHPGAPCVGCCPTCAGSPALVPEGPAAPCVPFGKCGLVCLGDSKREPDPPPESCGSDL